MVAPVKFSLNPKKIQISKILKIFFLCKVSVKFPGKKKQEKTSETRNLLNIRMQSKQFHLTAIFLSIWNKINKYINKIIPAFHTPESKKQTPTRQKRNKFRKGTPCSEISKKGNQLPSGEEKPTAPPPTSIQGLATRKSATHHDSTTNKHSATISLESSDAWLLHPAAAHTSGGGSRRTKE